MNIKLLAVLLLFTSSLEGMVLPCFYDQTDDDYGTTASDTTEKGKEKSSENDDTVFLDCKETYLHVENLRQRKTSVGDTQPPPQQKMLTVKPATHTYGARCKIWCLEHGIPYIIIGSSVYCSYCYPQAIPSSFSTIPLPQSEMALIGCCAACCTAGACCPDACDRCLLRSCKQCSCCLFLCTCAYVCRPHQ